MAINPTPGLNRHVREYLKHYLSLQHPPHYAVLLNGPWGIGKTFLIKRFLEEQLQDRRSYVYVSLNGLASVEEVNAALLVAMYPALGLKVTRFTGRAAQTAMRFFNIELDLKLSEIFSTFKAQVYVFDDLERCDLVVSSLLGYINAFVEHDDCKVIMVADEERLRKKAQGYDELREKVLGKVLEVQSVHDEALAHFISRVEDRSAKETLEARVAEITSLSRQSGLNNLRILQQTIWEFERLHKALADKHKSEDEAVDQLLRLFFCLSFEVRAGNIGEADLRERLEKLVVGRMESGSSASSPLLNVQARYPEVDLASSILSDEVLIDILIKGIVEADEIAQCLDRHVLFVAPGDEPAWRTVWHGIDRPDAEFERAYSQFEDDFAKRRLLVIGQILHAFGLRLWLSDIGVLGTDRSGVVRECKGYIEDLYERGTLEPLRPDASELFLFQGYDGLGFHCGDSDEFQELYRYLKQKRVSAYEGRYPALATDLLQEMENDSELFTHRMLGIDRQEDSYARLPVLAAIDPNTFVAAFLSLHPERQRKVLLVVKGRYEHGQLQADLKTEWPWLKSVRQKLLREAAKRSAIGKYRLTHCIKLFIDPVLPASSPKTEPDT